MWSPTNPLNLLFPFSMPSSHCQVSEPFETQQPSIASPCSCDKDETLTFVPSVL
jgi:hypothetical protein